MPVRIPIFVSAPTSLSRAQEDARDLIIAELEAQQFEARALGRTDYPADCPIREVFSIAKVCAGGVILGFSQYDGAGGTWKRGTEREWTSDGSVCFPSPWNQLEAGMLYALNVPLLVFRERGIGGGIFDVGSSELFINDMPTAPMKADGAEGLRQVFLKWSARVRTRYYRDS